MLLLFSSEAQVFYSTKPDYLKVKTERNNLLSDFRSSYPDTSIADLHNFFPRNFMGNIGLPSPNYILSYDQADLGFRLYPSPLRNDQFSDQQVQYFRSKGPYAELTGIAGSKQMQVLKLLFTQTYKDRLNLTLRFNRYGSQGYYLKQQTNVNNFFLSSNYVKPGQRAGYYFYFLNNGNRNQENGGIKSTTLNDSLMKFQKSLLPVKLSSAVRDNKEYKIMFNPWLQLNSAKDTANQSKRLNSILQLKSNTSISNYQYKDTHPVSDGFYKLTYLDTVQTRDSTHVYKFSNEVSYSLVRGDKKFGFSAGYRNETNKVWQKIDSLFMNHIVNSDLVLRKSFSGDSAKTKIQYAENRLNAQYIISGASSGNYKIEDNAEIWVNGRTRVFVNLMAENRNPDYIYNYWVGNNFQWFNNGFGPQQKQQAQIGFSLNKTAGVSLLFQNIGNYLYFDQQATPSQVSGYIQNISASAFYSTLLFRHLGISLNEVFQSTSSRFVNIPQNVVTVKLFYAGSFFKNNLLLNTGVQAQTFQSFYANAYMPATQVFYLQDNRTTGNYPYVDVYLNARIRPVSVFVKAENILAKFAGPDYSLVYGYYQTDSAIRFGLTWMFFD